MSYIHNKVANANFRFLWMELHNEVVWIRESPLFSNNAGKRIYIKSFISFVEGISHVLREFILENKAENISEEERIVLKGISVEINDKGEVRTRQKNYSPIQIFKFTFYTYGKLYNKLEVINGRFLMDEYKLLEETYKKRHQLTHPKFVEDLLITEDEINKAEEAHEWFHRLIIEALDGVTIIKHEGSL